MTKSEQSWSQFNRRMILNELTEIYLSYTGRLLMIMRTADLFSNAAFQCMSVKHRRRRHRLSKHILRLLHAKRKAWRNGLLSGNFDMYSDLRKTSRAAIRQHRRNLENRRYLEKMGGEGRALA